ncbi:hypothetical protein [Microvirga pudoricolor]|uniref:hypothetical protein n=1 Tax=Microvirga pudoricolor TaxID=2778729 RepID=UPI0019500B08|nr:hypothetical protein [Microvirga pudoricolor]MBM6593736.1 hypothetical protein [Microvirga pudoricolor]
MSRAMLKRLESLEQRNTRHDGKYHLVFGHSAEDLEHREIALRASSEWHKGDRVLSIRWMEPSEMSKGDVAVQGVTV